MSTNSRTEIWREWWADMRNSPQYISENGEQYHDPAFAYRDPPIVTGLPVETEVLISDPSVQSPQVHMISVPMVEVEENIARRLVLFNSRMLFLSRI